MIFFRCASIMYQACGPLHPTPLGDVPGVCGPLAGDAQLLLQLPDILFGVKPVQVSPVKSLLFPV